MSYPLALKISPKYSGEAVNEFYGYIERNAENVKTYRRNEGVRGLTRALYEYIILMLGVTGSLASIASIIWMAYEKYKERKKKKDGIEFIEIVSKKDVQAILNGKPRPSKKETSYEEKISNLRGPDIRILIDNPKSEKQIEILLDKDMKRDVFIKQFTQKVSAVMNDKGSKEKYEKIKSEISNTSIWIKKK